MNIISWRYLSIINRARELRSEPVKWFSDHFSRNERWRQYFTAIYSHYSAQSDRMRQGACGARYRMGNWYIMVVYKCILKVFILFLYPSMHYKSCFKYIVAGSLIEPQNIVNLEIEATPCQIRWNNKYIEKKIPINTSTNFRIYNIVG